MNCKLMSLVCLLALLLVSVIAAENVDVKSMKPMELTLNGSMSEPNAEKLPEEQKMQLPAKMEAEKLEISTLDPMKVTGFITASGTIFTIDDKRSVGVIQEARQNGLLTPQPGEFICNYGTVVVYTDRPCDDIMNMKKKEKKDKKNPNKTVKTETATETETDKETAQKQSTVANEKPQADDSTDMAVEMGTKDEAMTVVETKPMTVVEAKPMAETNEKKKKIKKTKKKTKKPKKNNKRQQNGVQRIRVKTKLVRRKPTQQQQNRPLRRPQNNRRPRPRPQQQQPQQQETQNQRRLKNRKRIQYQPQGALYATPDGKIYDLIEVAH